MQEKWYIKCSCGVGSKTTWAFESMLLADNAAKMHSMLVSWHPFYCIVVKHRTEVRAIETDEVLFVYEKGEQIWSTHKFDTWCM